MGILLTQETGFFAPIAKLMGYIMNLIFEALNIIGIHNIGLCIILFTIIIYMLMLPIQIKQQKFTRISNVMNVEIRDIQNKYKGKTDQASMLKMNEETKVVYEKYGTSPMGGCLGSLIQLPFLFALWPVVQNIPAYVGKFKAAFNQFELVDKIKATEGYSKILEKFATENRIIIEAKSFEGKNAIIDVLYKLDDKMWDGLAKVFPEISETGIIEKTEEVIRGYNYFPMSSFGFNIAETPSSMFKAAVAEFSILAIIVAILIPILAGLTQWMSMKISQNAMDANSPKKQDENDMARQMNTMMRFMPLMSVVFCYTMPTGLGLYWITSAVVRTIQQVAINKSLCKKSIDDIIKENMDKAAKKRANKKNVSSENMNTMAKMYTRKLEEIKAEADNKEVSGVKNQSTTTSSSAKPGSLASKANMVRDFNNRNNK